MASTSITDSVQILTEMSNEFDILWNNIMSNAAPGLNEYEKSVFLTKAQDEIIKNYFNPKGNKYQEGFDGNQKRQVDFSMLIKTAKDETVSITPSGVLSGKFDSRSKAVKYPTDVMFILNEMVEATNDVTITTKDEITNVEVNSGAKYVALSVMPVSFSEYTRLMAKPYKYPPKNICWRLLNLNTDTVTPKEGTDKEATTSDYRVAELITSYKCLKNYVVRYVKQPDPIILVDLDDNYSDVSIGGKTQQTAYSLDPILIHEIVQRAVELAKAAYSGDLQSLNTLGQRSE